MVEPELPGIPPPPHPPWWKRPLRIVRKPKLPGWAVLLLLALREIPDWKGRIDFWLAAAKEAGGYAGAAAIVIDSPYFSLGLAGIGVLWLAFVGEPRRGIQRHPWLPYIGWTFAGLIFAAVALTAGWGALQIYVQSEVSQKTREQFWHLNDVQKQNLAIALDTIPEDQRFPIYFRIVFANAQALTMADDLSDIFRQHGNWNILGAQDALLRADLLGINIVIAMDQGRADKDMPPHAQELAYIFEKAGIKFSGALEPRFDNNSLQLAIGSRPPNW
jgi:hypothetical protein